ncbi:MAG: hypothetical protein HRU19_28020 [Pseudobacteriovorax sp.]|nr:hypothetical protein [Pseudobacteriovorax sp.]
MRSVTVIILFLIPNLAGAAIGLEDFNQILINGNKFKRLDISSSDPSEPLKRLADFKAVTAKNPQVSNHGVSWFSFEISNPGHKAIRSTFNLHNVTIESFQLYRIRDDLSGTTHVGVGGHDARFGTSDLSPGHSISLDILPGTSRYLMRVSAPLMRHIVPSLWDRQESFLSHMLAERNYLSMVVSVEIVLAVLNLSLFLLFRQTMYIWYVAWLSCFSVFLYLNYGVSEFANPLYRQLSPWIGTFSVCLAQASAVMFIASFFGLTHGFLLRLYRGLAAIALFNGFYLFVAPGQAIDLIHVHLICSILLALVTGIGLSLKKRKLHLQVFSTAFGVVSLVYLYGSLENNGLIDSFTIEVYPLGSMIEHLIMTIAIGFKFKNTITQNTHFVREMKKVLYPHQVQKLKEFHYLEKTMPVGQEQGCALVFDIQKSSELIQEDKFAFFESVIKACHARILERYCEKTLSAEAFMIKEMGDGFLCSVGFPFSYSGNHQDKAIELAYSFVTIFQEKVREFFPGSEVFCAIGIARGMLTSYYPRIGIRQYDLYGDAIVKAHRYESYRSALFKNGITPGNIIIVQEEVLNYSEAYTKKDFSEYSLRQERVRNDESAPLLFYKVITNSTSTSVLEESA